MGVDFTPTPSLSKCLVKFFRIARVSEELKLRLAKLELTGKKGSDEVKGLTLQVKLLSQQALPTKLSPPSPMMMSEWNCSVSPLFLIPAKPKKRKR